MTKYNCPHDMGALIRQEEGIKVILCLMCGEEYEELIMTYNDKTLGESK